VRRDAERFLSAAGSDPGLAKEMSGVVDGRDFDTAIEDLVALARRKGFDATAQDFRDLRRAIAAAASGGAGDADLSDDELEDVTGGLLGYLKDVGRMNSETDAEGPASPRHGKPPGPRTR